MTPLSSAPVYDFHTHTLLSDGELTIMELIRRAQVAGYAAIAISDHMGIASLSRLIPEVAAECALAQAQWGIVAVPAVELTHLPPALIPQAAEKARELGARLILVHGETIVEPVEPGTNRAALLCRRVDILAHPGLLTLEEAKLAADNDIYLELSARRGHCLTNGHIVSLARRTGARLLIGSDAHSPDDLLTPALARQIALGSGLTEDEYPDLQQQALLLLRRASLP